MNYKNLFDFLKKQESILVLLLILISILTLILFSEKPIYLLVINIVILVLYFLLSNRPDKLIVAIAALNFAFWGVILESFIIQKTNFALQYKENMGVLYVPAWLFTIYVIFLISAIFTYDSIKALLK
tara:strand:- start:254 stop:634 length:381 start_codon:yes stop_codon:yes gene_type:complete